MPILSTCDAAADAGPISVLRLTGFDDPVVGPGEWDRLLGAGPTNEVFLTREWLESWWETLGFGELLLLAAVRQGRLVALAPFCTSGGMVFFLGFGQSDYLDFIGEVEAPGVLRALVTTARAATPDFNGFRLFSVPDQSPTGAGLQGLDRTADLVVYPGPDWVGPFVNLQVDRARVLAASKGPKLAKRDRFFRRDGTLELKRLTSAEEIIPRLEGYFAQHIERWRESPDPSAFADASTRGFFERFTRRMGPTGRLRFSCLEWNGRAIAFEYGWSHGGTYVGGPSCFAMDLASRSPGQVLQRELVLAALAEGTQIYDFGIGEEPYKFIYANQVRRVRTWELYAPEYQ